jgi:eukaryotic-like serine/threonine-protein kinase
MTETTKSPSDPGSEEARRLRRLRALFDGAIELPAAERDAWLARETDGDRALQLEVEALITASAETDARLVPGTTFMRLAREWDSQLEGQRLGPYTVAHLVGSGGMGAVYEAVRADDQYRKRVAIKIVRRELGSEISLARFRRERQILATLSHPNVATLLDGGVTPDGRPFLVMEYVEGQPITKWCDARRASIRERLALFRQLCAAAAHAHKNLVVHYDIKPGNVLVTADGTVKLLDFGIAKLIVADGAESDMPATHGDSRAFTPEYASPEQIRGDALTTASDVYSLGVVLFELLAGQRPSDGSPPSAAATDASAQARALRDADRLRRALRGELDAIVLTALRTEPDRRYPSADAMSQDIRRYLDGFPVTARRDTARYRIAKFVSRNRAAVAGATVAALAVLFGTTIAILQARAARYEEQRATRVASFLQGLLGAGDVSWASPTRIAQVNPSVVDALDSAAKRLPHELASEPLIRASLYRTVGRALLYHNRTAEARGQLDSAYTIHLREFGPDNAEAATDLHFLAYATEGVTADSSESIIRRAVSMMQRNRPDTIDDYVPALHDLAYYIASRGRLAESESLFALVLRDEQARPSPRRALLAITNGSLALSLWNEGRLDTAVALMKRGVAIFDSLPTADLAEKASALETLASALSSTGHAADALPYIVEAKPIVVKLYGPRATSLVQLGVSLGDAYLGRGDTARADREARAAIALGDSLPAGSENGRFQAEWTYTRSLRKQKRFEEAEVYARRQYALAEKSVKDIPYYWADATFMLGAVLVDRGRAAEAEPYLLDSYRTSRDRLGSANLRAARTLPLLVTVYDALGRPAVADTYRALMPDTMRARVDSTRTARR